jgi:actin-like ATPase involved in cell morphogenesis
MAIYGLDFGTTNSLASIVVDGEILSLVNKTDELPHPSVVQYHGDEVIVGREAKNALETTESGVIGNFVRSPKRFLGSGEKIHVGGVARNVSDVVAEILKHLRKDALQRHIPDETFDRAVMTIPVNAIGRARRDLREAALKAGIHIHQFVQEPFAALYGYLRTCNPQRKAELEGQIILVFDWGGGTLDLTLCKITKGMIVQIQSKGDNNVGGDRFDDRLIRYAKNEHFKQYNLDALANELPHVESKLIAQCELAKIGLSDRASVNIFVPHYLKSDGPERTLEIMVTREKLIELIKDIIDAGLKNIDELLESASVNEASIALCLATGGMVRMPYIRERLIEKFDLLRVPHIENGDTIISEGAAWIAHDEVRLTLAKPFELLLGNDNYSTLIPERTELPNENPITLPFSTYCIDPRDGYAIFEFARPVWPGRNLPGDPRKSYATLLVAVDPEATPLTEKLKVEIAIDHDLIVTVAAESTMVKHRRKREIHNLEFGLSVGTKSIESSPDGRKTEKQSNIPYKKTEGSIKLRSNVVRGNQAWDLVPGDLVEKYRIHLPPQWTATKRQHDEEMYYIPCSGCDRTWHQIQLEGSENCPCRAGNVKEIDAQKRKRKLLERKKELEIRESTLNEGKK